MYYMKEIIYKFIDDELENKIISHFGDYIIKHKVLHKGEGCYSIAAMDGEEPIGFISTYPLQYPEPLSCCRDAYIDVIEVDKKYRRMGIARQMINLTENWAKEYGYKQIRAWSNNTKKEAIPMWYALDYCICPAKIWVEWCNEIVDGFYVAKKLNSTI
jgi:GNAT superfamily N-acetyltransferase